jgi:site-specific recombinase XerD
VVNASEIDDSLAQRFLKQVPSTTSFRDAPSAVRHVLNHLRETGVIAPAPVPASSQPFTEFLARYDHHLDHVRGLAPETRRGYIDGARRLLVWMEEHRNSLPLEAISAPDVLAFLLQRFEQVGRRCRQDVCARTRAVLRYLLWERIVEADLARVVPKLRTWRLSSVPRHLPWEQVRILVDSVDTSHPQGLRDKAILLLLAGLGLRNFEVRTLVLSDIRWREAEIRLRRTKTRRERVLPLSQEVGEAVASYILHARPKTHLPEVFLRHRAPPGAFRGGAAISGIVRRHLLKAGIDAPRYGAHLLRHSLATRMVNVGVSIKGIADVLGHASIDTTAIYTKVDRTNLMTVAMPFPGGLA